MNSHTHPEPENDPQPAPVTGKRLYRSTSDRMVAGVAGGIAEYFNIDPTLVRVLSIPLILIHGIGGAAYIIAWVVIPENPISVKQPEKAPSPDKIKTIHDDAPAHHGATATMPTNESSRRVFGIILLAAGAYFFLRQFIDFSFYGQFWPLLLVLIGLIIIFGRGRRA